jgi:hypothetical protein
MVNHVVCIVVAVVLPILAQFPATAQDRTNPHRVGWISPESEEVVRRANAAYGGIVARRTFADLGYREGKDFIIDARYAAGRFGLGPELTNELLRAGAEVLVTGCTNIRDLVRRVVVTIVDSTGCGCRLRG